MAVNFTPEQQQVIGLHHCNILVSAAAGSGKTAVLVERIVRMVCDEEKPVDIDRLLVVTFTNAAAAEMRERIAAGIALRLQEVPESEHIQRQAALLHNAQITTIDSFSLFLIRNHFNEIGLDPAFRVADEGEIRLLRQETLAELMEEGYAGGGQLFRDCVEYFCPGGRESVLEQHILNLSQYAASFPWPKEWLEMRREDYRAATEDELLESDYGKYLKVHIGRMIKSCVEKLKEVLRICESPDGPYMYGELVDSELCALQKLLCCSTLEEYAGRLPAISFGRLPSKKDESVSALKRERAKQLRSEVKSILQKLSERFFATPLPLALKQGRECMAPVGVLIDLVLAFDERMKEKKQQRKIIDFSDMEHYALDILITMKDGKREPSAVAKEYRQYFHEILIDEYQDSNLVQELLLSVISGEEDGRYNRFMVGDVKQSIYKFRLARPELFLEKYETYGVEGDFRRIDLAKNFRSRTQVVNTVNDIFGRMMSKEIGGIAYDERAALYAGAVYPENEESESELLLVEKPENAKDAKKQEALAIAHRIKELCTSCQVNDRESGGLRLARYKDMVILLRTTSGWDETFKKVLEQEGIPVHITSRTGYFAASEVQELLQLLRVLDNPKQDIPLYAVMKSIFGGFTEEEIAIIRSRERAREDGEPYSLYEAVCAYAAVEDNAVADKADSFLKQLLHYRGCTVYMPIRELLQRLVEDYDYLNYVTALPAGGKRRANVEMLFTKASDFEKTSYFGLFHFIRYMEQLEKYDVDYGEADVLDENADVVRIMSIHKSKGLEFPITFVAGLSKRFNMQDANQTLLVDMDMGVACDYVNPVRRIRNKTLRRMILSKKMREDSLSEELRVLYVALTRAREKLILSAVLEGAEEKWELFKENAEQKLGYADFMEAGSYMDFLLPILGNVDIKVSLWNKELMQGEQLKEQLSLLKKRDMLEAAAEYADSSRAAFLEERFAFVYPFKALEGLYTKTTVSELKRAAMAEADEGAYASFEEKEIVPYIPRFRRNKEGVSGAVYGNAVHRFMELVSFQELLGGQFLEFPKTYADYQAGLADAALVQGLCQICKKEQARLRLSEEYASALRIPKLVQFFKSRLAYRMWAAEKSGQLYREQPFVLGISARRLGEGFPADEQVLIQGIIDAFFIENEEIVLLDYKTDVVSSLQELWNRYNVQLEYYVEALKKIKGISVKEKILYSFHLDEY